MLKKSDHHSSAKAVIAFLIVALAFTVMVLFYNYRIILDESGNLKTVLFLIFLGSTLMLALLYLVNKPHNEKVKSRKKG